MTESAAKMDQQPPDIARDVGHALVNALPPVTLWALTLNDWLAVFGIAYIALQAAYLIWRWHTQMRTRK